MSKKRCSCAVLAGVMLLSTFAGCSYRFVIQCLRAGSLPHRAGTLPLISGLLRRKFSTISGLQKPRLLMRPKLQ